MGTFSPARRIVAVGHFGQERRTSMRLLVPASWPPRSRRAALSHATGSS